MVTMAKGRAKRKTLQKMRKEEKRREKKAMRCAAGLFMAVFVAFLLRAAFLSWKITISPNKIDDLLLEEAEAAIYYAFGTTGIVTVLTRKPPQTDTEIERLAGKSFLLMAVSFVSMGLLRRCTDPTIQFLGSIMQIPLYIGINLFFACLGHLIDWLGKHLDHEKLKRFFG